MRHDYAADKLEIDREHSAREARCPVATALRDEIAQASGDGWAYAECCDAISSQVDLTPTQVAALRTAAALSVEAQLELAAMRFLGVPATLRCISCGDSSSDHLADHADEKTWGRCTVAGCPCTVSPRQAEQFEEAAS